jgi:UDP-N-acetyl-D-glucosamine dehydrogenase
MTRDHADTLARLIDARDAAVAVIGLGYVGLPLLDTMASAGFRAIGLDDDAAKIDALGAGRNYLPHLGPDLPARLTGNERVTLTSDRTALAGADAALICVPTPLDAANQPDHGYVRRAALAIHEHAVTPDPARPRLVCLESTTYPGATRRIVAPIVRGRHADAPVFVAFSPEREDPGRSDLAPRQIPKLVGGTDDESGRLAHALYASAFERVVPCASAEVAEAAKLVENVYRAVNIALANELKVTLDAMGLDVWEVLDAASTKPFGFQRFDPGPGFGGHCVPIDPFYLAWTARGRRAPRRGSSSSPGEINQRDAGPVA